VEVGRRKPVGRIRGIAVLAIVEVLLGNLSKDRIEEITTRQTVEE
jgi:hypothetical protein